jgi:hypothetical protein
VRDFEKNGEFKVMRSPMLAESRGHLEGQVVRRIGNRIHDLRILVRPGGLVLKGRTGTYHAKQLAQHAAMDLAGMRVLANDIEVCPA